MKLTRTWLPQWYRHHHQIWLQLFLKRHFFSWCGVAVRNLPPPPFCLPLRQEIGPVPPPLTRVPLNRLEIFFKPKMVRALVVIAGGLISRSCAYSRSQFSSHHDRRMWRVSWPNLCLLLHPHLLLSSIFIWHDSASLIEIWSCVQYLPCKSHICSSGVAPV